MERSRLIMCIDMNTEVYENRTITLRYFHQNRPGWENLLYMAGSIPEDIWDSMKRLLVKPMLQRRLYRVRGCPVHS